LSSNHSLNFKGSKKAPDNAVIDIFILNSDNGEHPFHMHGHQFPIIATSVCPQAEQAFAEHYLRRDVVSIPPMVGNNTGWAWIRLVANNPGVWMFHCHIDWHMEAGLGCLFMESPTHVATVQPPHDQVQFCSISSPFCGGSSSAGFFRNNNSNSPSPSGQHAQVIYDNPHQHHKIVSSESEALLSISTQSDAAAPLLRKESAGSSSSTSMLEPLTQ